MHSVLGHHVWGISTAFLVFSEMGISKEQSSSFLLSGMLLALGVSVCVSHDYLSCALSATAADTMLCPSQGVYVERHFVHLLLTGDHEPPDQYLGPGTLTASGGGECLLSEGQADYECLCIHMCTWTCMHFSNYEFIPEPLNPDCPQGFFLPQPFHLPRYINTFYNFLNSVESLKLSQKCLIRQIF